MHWSVHTHACHGYGVSGVATDWPGAKSDTNAPFVGWLQLHNICSKCPWALVIYILKHPLYFELISFPGSLPHEKETLLFCGQEGSLSKSPSVLKSIPYSGKYPCNNLFAIFVDSKI